MLVVYDTFLNDSVNVVEMKTDFLKITVSVASLYLNAIQHFGWYRRGCADVE